MCSISHDSEKTLSLYSSDIVSAERFITDAGDVVTESICHKLMGRTGMHSSAKTSFDIWQRTLVFVTCKRIAPDLEVHTIVSPGHLGQGQSSVQAIKTMSYL